MNVSIRREGASVLGANNKWGNFPGVSAGWVINKENFLADSNAVKFLKLRAGYGVTGNQESLSPYQSLARIGLPLGATQSGYLGSPDGGTWIMAYGPLQTLILCWNGKQKQKQTLGLILLSLKMAG